MSKPRIYNQSFAVGQPYINLTSIRDGDGNIFFRQGTYTFSQGVVRIYQQGYRINDAISAKFNLVKDGWCYQRNISGKLYSDRGLAIMAGKFAREVCKPVELEHIGQIKPQVT